MVAGEAIRVPGGAQSLENSTNYKLRTLGTAWGKQNLEVMLAVLAPLKLKEDAVLEGSKALGTDEAPCVEKVSVRVDRLPIFVESLFAVVAVARRVSRRFRWCSWSGRRAGGRDTLHLHVVWGGHGLPIGLRRRWRLR